MVKIKKKTTFSKLYQKNNVHFVFLCEILYLLCYTCFQTLSTLVNSLQRRNMFKMAASLRQCLVYKNTSSVKTLQEGSQRSNLRSNCAVTSAEHTGNIQRTVHIQSRPVTPSIPEYLDDHNNITEIENMPQQTLTQNHSRAVTLVKHDSADLSKVKPGQLSVKLLNSKRSSNQTETIGNFENKRKREGTPIKSRAVTPTGFADSDSMRSRENYFKQPDILEEIKVSILIALFLSA